MKRLISHIHPGSLVFLCLLAVPLGVFAQPVANFTASPLAGCSPLIVNFQDLSTGNPTSWNWNFGNGNTSTLQNPVASYFTPGTYTITLVATNASGFNTLVRTGYITVYEPPAVDFSANVLSGCFPLRVQLTDLSSPGAGNSNISWNWDFGNGVTSTLQNPQVTYTSAGAYNVTLRVTNDKGCTRTLSRPSYITVTPGVSASFTFTQPTVCQAPADISFTNGSTGPPTLTYSWDFGDGNFSTATSPVHTYASNGSYTVTLATSSSAGCQDTLHSSPILIGANTSSFTYPPAVCINEPVLFTNTSAPVPASANWAFGDGGTAAGINATHSYSVPGIYTVKLYNTFSNCIDSIAHDITVNPRPVADFTAPATVSCQPPLAVNFQDLSTGGATAWQWDFGDGNTSTAQHPSHTYSTYGSFTVTLIATNAFGCTDTIVKPNFIRIRKAQVSIPSLPARGCVPFTITPTPVINALDAVTSYEWDFGDGGSSTLAIPTHTYIAQGTYTVRLVITTSTGCQDTLTIPAAVRVGTKPMSNFSAAPNPVCARQPVQFTDLSVPADEWHWDFGDGSTSTLQNPVHIFSDTGYFSIQLVAVNNGCPDTLIRPNYIYVKPPIARYTPTPDCANRLRFTFTDLSIAPLTWEWDFGDGSPRVTTQNTVHIFPALGLYSVRLVVTNGGCSDTTALLINAIDERANFTADQTTLCKPGTVQFSPVGINTANILTYTWDFGDGNTSTVNTAAISHTYLNSGLYTVTLTIRDNNGCTSTLVQNNYIRVNGPVAGFTASNVAGCTGLVTTFNDLSTTDGVNNIVNWKWDFGDGTIQQFNAPPFQHTYNTAGTFTVKLVITDGTGCMDSLTRTDLVIATDPIPDFVTADTLSCPGGTIHFTNTSQPAGLTSSWDFGDGNTSAVYSPVHSYAATGLYTVKLRVNDTYGCADSVSKTNYVRVALPVPGFTVSDSVTSCTPLEVQFTNTSVFYSSVSWDFGVGQGISTLENPVHFFSSPGIYPVKMIITSPGGCKDSLTRIIQVYDTAGSRLNYSPIGGCKPLSISMNTLTPGPMVSYFWDFGDGNTEISATPSATHTYTSFGNFIPKVIMEDPSGCLIPLQGVDTLLIIGAKANFGADTAFFCDFGTVHFTDSTTFNDPVILYNWDFGDGGSSALQYPSHQYTAQGIYNVQLTVQTQAGCRDSLVKQALIKVIQRPLIDIAGESVICVNNSILHSGIFIRPDTSLVRWQWSFPNGNTDSVQNPPRQTYTDTGTFSVTAIAINSSGCADTTRQTIVVNPLPAVTMPGQLTIQSGFPVTIPATYSPNTVSWIWSPATGLSCGNCPTPEAGPKFNTNYEVYFTDVNNCSNTGRIQITVICKDGNLFIPNTFSPNGDGSNDVFYPRGRGLERVKLLRIFNRWGEIVFERRDFPVNDASAGWNGSYKGQKPKADVYVYQAEVFCENGDTIRLNGNIALIL
ncbi:MAG: PKD domain-containing protein [Sphingobacteriales bacterium]|nr:PKD domain-containing protein [Sphingobacteriales bacterium]